MERIALRPHHGMCFQFYEGKGYSEEFTDHMTGIIRELEANPLQEITLRSELDIICANCPNRESQKCTSQDKVTRYDEAVLKLCGLDEGSVISYGDFIKLVRERILDPGRRKEICGDCIWDCSK